MDIENPLPVDSVNYIYTGYLSKILHVMQILFFTNGFQFAFLAMKLLLMTLQQPIQQREERTEKIKLYFL